MATCTLMMNKFFVEGNKKMVSLETCCIWDMIVEWKYRSADTFHLVDGTTLCHLLMNWDGFTMRSSVEYKYVDLMTCMFFVQTSHILLRWKIFCTTWDVRNPVIIGYLPYHLVSPDFWTINLMLYPPSPKNSQYGYRLPLELLDREAQCLANLEILTNWDISS